MDGVVGVESLPLVSQQREGSSKGTVGSLEWIHVLFVINYNKMPIINGGFVQGNRRFPGFPYKKLNYLFLNKLEATTPITTAHLLNNNRSLTKQCQSLNKSLNY